MPIPRRQASVLLLAWCFSFPAYPGDAPLAQAPEGRPPAQGKAASPAAPPDQSPVTVEADRIEGRQEDWIEAEGKVKLERDGQKVFADQLIYFPVSNDVYADGHVRVEQYGDVVEGPHLNLNLDRETGRMEQPRYRLEQTGGRGEGKELLFEGKNRYRAKDASYTTCPVGNDDWFLRVGDLDIDRNRQIGTAKNASIVFKNTPILYTPWMNFPLSNQRKSGFLSPIFGSTAEGGPELTVPYYWNLAPNRDATIAPRFIKKRGVMLNDEFRYLEPNFNGEIHADFLPNDRVTGTNRYGLSVIHGQNFGNGWSGGLNLQKVSDDAYFRDLSNQLTLTSQTNLPRDAYLAYGGGGWWSLVTRVQKFQTLQDPNAPITPPYFREPQILLNANRFNVRGADLSLASEFDDFRHPTLVNGKRLVLYPSVSYPLRTAWGYVTPKLGFHSTRYVLDTATTTLPDATRNVPIFSLDSGVVFERDLTLSGTPLLQTLEPRLYYVYIPFRDQSGLPNFDSAEADFNFTQIFTENRFTGNDRIGDANQVTLALTSRLLEPNTGNERLRFALGQRFSFETPRVALNTPVSTESRSNILAAVTGQVAPHWLMDAGWQYDPNRSESEKISFAARYQPEPGKVANFGYRFFRNNFEQIDASAQWPLSRRWHGLVRYNYSLQDSRLLEALGGLEYSASCWVARFVVQRFVTATQATANAFFIQLELNGLTKLGSDPLTLLRQSIPGYAKVNDIPSSGAP